VVYPAIPDVVCGTVAGKNPERLFGEQFGLAGNFGQQGIALLNGQERL